MKWAWGTCVLPAVVGCTAASFTPLQTKLAYQVNALRCSNGCSVTVGAPDTVLVGDSLRVTITLADTAPGDSQYVRQILGTAGSDETRPFLWVVDSTLTPGTYSLRADMLVDPLLEARRSIVVR
jgi:hypothetical protein